MKYVEVHFNNFTLFSIYISMKGDRPLGMYSYFKIGDVVNNWTIISECFRAKSGKDCYRCRCICGNESNVEGRALA